MTTSIAVIIPTYNRSQLLRRAIESVLRQTRPADEIVVVDDGSTDDTAAVCAQFPDVKYLCKANGGLPAARNYGIDQTRSQLLVFLDDDDELKPATLERQEKAFQSDPDLGLVYGRADLIDGQNRVIGEHLKNHTSPPNHFEALLVDNYILIQTVMVSRAWVDRIGRFRCLLGEDLDLYLRLSLAGARFCFIDAKLANYRKLPGTMSSDKLAYAQAILSTIERSIPNFPADRSPSYYTAYYHYRVGRAALERQQFQAAATALQEAIRGRPGQLHFRVYWLAARWPAIFFAPLNFLRQVKRSLWKLLSGLGLVEQRWGSGPAK